MKPIRVAPTQDDVLTAPLRLRFLPNETQDTQASRPIRRFRNSSSLGAYFGLGLMVGAGLWLYRGQLNEFGIGRTASPSELATHVQEGSTDSQPIVGGEAQDWRHRFPDNADRSFASSDPLNAKNEDGSEVVSAEFISSPEQLPLSNPKPLLDRLMNDR